MALSTTAAIVASAVIAAGASEVTANAQRKSAGGRARAQRELAKKERIAEVARQEQDLQRGRDSLAVEKAAAERVQGSQLRTQDIRDDFGSLDVGALGATPGDTATAALSPTGPNAGV